MEDIEVRSALKEYVTEAEPPIGLTGEGVLAAGRRSRRRRVTALVTGVTMAAVGFPAGTALVVLPDRSEPAATSPCGEKVAEEAPDATKARLDCVLGHAIRAHVSPADPLALEARQGRDTRIYSLGSRVRDRLGTGSVYVDLIPNNGTLLSAGMACRNQVPAPTTCSAHLIGGGTLMETTTRKPGNPGLITYQATYQTEQAVVIVTTTNSGEPATDDRPEPPAQRETPPLTETQLRDIALTPGLMP